MPKKFSSSTRYAFAIGCVGAATLLRFLLSHLLGAQFPFFSFYVAVTVTAWLAGFGPALAATVLGFLAGDLFFYSPNEVGSDPEGISVYLSVALTICFIARSMHQARSHSEIVAADARTRQKELEEEIAQRIAAEQALRLSEEQFRISFQLAAVGQAQIDPASGRFLRVNAKLCEMTGYTEQELLEMTVRQITFPEDNEFDTKLFRKMIAGQVAQGALEKRYVCKGGRVIWVNVAAAVVCDKEGKPWRTNTVIQDVTARRKAEEALSIAQEKLQDYTGDLEKLVAERTAKLTDTVHSLESFCYSIAHDLRAPIRAMQSFAAILAEDTPLNERGRDYTARIVSAAGRMDHLVSDLLAYGRLAHEEIEPQLINLEVAVDQALHDLGEEVKVKHAEIQVLRPLPRAVGHPAIVKQVLLNLLRNAMKFVAPGTVPHVYIRAEETDEMVRLCIDDNGIGIEAQYQARIFNVFERLHANEEYPGTGIGLAIVKKGVERMGGTVGVHSQFGHGSCFWFELKKQHPIHLLPPPVVENRLRRFPKLALR